MALIILAVIMMNYPTTFHTEEDILVFSYEEEYEPIEIVEPEPDESAEELSETINHMLNRYGR